MNAEGPKKFTRPKKLEPKNIFQKNSENPILIGKSM